MGKSSCRQAGASRELFYRWMRAVLGFKKSAEVYFKAPGIEEIPRDEFLGKVLEYEAQIGMMGTERTRRTAIRLAMQYWEVYEEWTELPW